MKLASLRINLKNIAIVGCGPAGLSAAIALHDAGHYVTIYEQFDKPGPVGSGLMLQPTGLRVLERWGLRDQAETLGQRIDGMLGRVAPAGKVVLDINYRVLSDKHDGELYGVAIHRAALFDILFKAAKARDIQVVTGETIYGTFVSAAVDKNKTTIQLVSNNGITLNKHYDLVVDASGSRSKLVEHAGLSSSHNILPYGALWTTVELNDERFNKTRLEQRYQGANVMIGILPCGNLPGQDKSLATLFWSIKGDDYSDFKATGLDAWKARVIKQWPDVKGLLKQIEHVDQLTHATYTHHTLSKPYASGIVFIGDAAHATSPQLGQGANMALLDSLALTQAMNCHDQHTDYAALYARMRRNHVRLYQAASYLLTPFYQSDSRILPTLRDTFFEPVSKLPYSAKIVTSLGSGLTANPINAIDTNFTRAKKALKN